MTKHLHGPGHAWMRTYTDGWIDVLNPNPEDVHLGDIAVHLGREFRYGNARHLTVAEHAVLTSYVCEYALEALHHDDSEAYLGDMVGTFKRQVQNSYFRAVETGLQSAVAARFGLDTSPAVRAAVKAADDAVFLAEVRVLWPDEFDDMRKSRGVEAFVADVEVQCLGCQAATDLYLARHEELTNGR